MKFFLTSLALAASAYAQQLTINTPTNPVVCQPSLLNWSGGTPPYFLSILPGNQPSAPALFSFPTQNGNSITWNVNYPVGTSLGLTIKDSTGASGQSAAFTVQAGPDTSCLNASGSSSGTPSGTPTGATSSGTASTSGTVVSTTSVAATTRPTTSLVATIPVTTTAPLTTPTTRPATTTTGGSNPATSGNSAPANAVNMGVAGIVGAAVVALLA